MFQKCEEIVCRWDAFVGAKGNGDLQRKNKININFLVIVDENPTRVGPMFLWRGLPEIFQ